MTAGSPAVSGVSGVLSAGDIARTAASIAGAQQPSGAIPWYVGGALDPWDHVEAAMALSAAGRLPEAERAHRWLARAQRPDGSWPRRIRDDRAEDPGADTNFCAYPAVGIWHHYLISGDERFAEAMWPMVRAAVDFVLSHQTARGEIAWTSGSAEALLAGCSSIHHSLRCALALAEHLGLAQPGWELGLGRLAHVLTRHEQAFADRRRFSMDWYYPVLGGALRGTPARQRLAARWDEFVVPGLGVRCVDDHPWVTGGETCELALALDAVGDTERAGQLLADVAHLRDPDGSYWTGLVYTDGKRWPVERTTWTAGAMLLAADALSRASPGNGIFRAEELPAGLAVADQPCGCGATASRRSGEPGSAGQAGGPTADALELP